MTHPLFEQMKDEPAYDGQPAKLVELENASGMRAVFMDIGATWLSCSLPLANGESREVLLGVDSMQNFKRQQSYMGVTVGRYANRIAKGAFTLNGHDYVADINQNGNSLHGGAKGFHALRWEIENQSKASVTFAIHSPDGDQGFPGNVVVKATYTLSDDNALQIDYFAETDKPTPLNMTNHAYFNLDGTEHTCLEHELWLDAPWYLPIDEVGIPNQDPTPVTGTGFDFTSAKTLGQDLLTDAQQKPHQGYDHAYLFDGKRDVSQAVARLIGADKQVTLHVYTDKPAIQLYSGNWLAGTPGRGGQEYQAYNGVALETQFLPDSPNHLDWPQPSCILEPNQTYQSSTRYAFSC
ncbi:aldose 1-epimerase [Vibrio xiamenensis]|uniref:Aldose 1-epimerase n=1 Tax=Vibrio xiamenensis TaxID=861298 RepID=A0A1G7XLG6_9VIBR|nr:aldose 1-epimerase [Vibrio xiamenensis]